MIFLLLNLLWLVPLAVVIAILRVSKREIPHRSGSVGRLFENDNPGFEPPKLRRDGSPSNPFRRECTPELARRLRRQIAERLRKL